MGTVGTGSELAMSCGLRQEEQVGEEEKEQVKPVFVRRQNDNVFRTYIAESPPPLRRDETSEAQLTDASVVEVCKEALASGERMAKLLGSRLMDLETAWAELEAVRAELEAAKVENRALVKLLEGAGGGSSAGDAGVGDKVILIDLDCSAAPGKRARVAVAGADECLDAQMWVRLCDGCGDKAGGDKGCGDEGCGDEGCGEEGCGDKGCGDEGCGEEAAGAAVAASPLQLFTGEVSRVEIRCKHGIILKQLEKPLGVGWNDKEWDNRAGEVPFAFNQWEKRAVLFDAKDVDAGLPVLPLSDKEIKELIKRNLPIHNNVKRKFTQNTLRLYKQVFPGKGEVGYKKVDVVGVTFWADEQQEPKNEHVDTVTVRFSQQNLKVLDLTLNLRQLVTLAREPDFPLYVGLWNASCSADDTVSDKARWSKDEEDDWLYSMRRIEKAIKFQWSMQHGDA